MHKKKIEKLLKKLFPINRSITGNGIRKSLQILKRYNHNIKIKKIRSGTKVYDWKVPNEWNYYDAYIKLGKKKIIDSKINNLHLVNFSCSVNKKIKFSELKKKLHFIKKFPNAIPYVTSYYKKNWGFCLSYKQFNKIKKIKEKFHVFINTKFKKGSLVYGEYFKKGRISKEIVFSTYICHPSMANNELSGPAVCLDLCNWLKSKNTKYSYRILFLPETIGSISFINKNIKNLKKNTLAGFVLTCLGDEGRFSIINSRYKNTYADKIALEELSKLKSGFRKYSYLERGSDERQFCSPMVDLPFCCITRSKFKSYKQYHTSLDNLNFIKIPKLIQSTIFFKKIITKIEKNEIPISQIKCEPFLTKRNLNKKKNKNVFISDYSKSIIDYMSYADGTNNVKHISNILKKNYSKIKDLSKILENQKLIKIY